MNIQGEAEHSNAISSLPMRMVGRNLTIDTQSNIFTAVLRKEGLNV